MSRVIAAAMAAILALAAAVPAALAHAFLERADPPVGSATANPPAAVTLWFSQELEPAFSSVTVTDQTGRRVDLGNTQVPAGHPDTLQVGLPAMAPGPYMVSCRVVSVDTHPTEGTFTFTVGSR